MRGKRTLTVLMLAIVFGGLAGWSALRLLNQSALAVEPARVSAAQVVVAARDLEVGHLLGQEDVKVIEWPSTTVPEGYAQTIPDVVGRGIITGVRRNEPLLDSKMADRSGHGGLPIAIPEGMRAVSVPVDEVVSVAGFVVQGTRVDLYVTITPPGGSDPITKLVLQNVTVLAAGQEYRQDPQGQPTSVSVLTVLVSPEDGEKLVHAQRTGRIQLALRGMLDVRSVRTSGARVAQLLANPRAPSSGGTRRAVAPGPAPGDETPVVEVYKGGVKALIRF